MRFVASFLIGLVLCVAAPAAKTLDIYFIDVEGGQATLIVSPSGETMLIDAGWAAHNGRDLDRILAAAKAAKVKRIDTLLVTHFHADHAGGVLALAEKMPIGRILDHGVNSEAGGGGTDRAAQVLSEDYAKAVAHSRRDAVKAGDTIAVKGLEITVVSSDGAVIGGDGNPNPLCGTQKPANHKDISENVHSAAVIIQYGKFRFADFGDITWDLQMKLACPGNKAGKADIYLTTHHGNDDSPAAMIHALAPRVAIFNNGARKGGTPVGWQTVKTSPGLEDLWQLHYSVAGGAEFNVADTYIANVGENCEGKYIKVTAESTGAFTVYNARNKYLKSYAAR